jgi:hypothetical protein
VEIAYIHLNHVHHSEMNVACFRRLMVEAIRAMRTMRARGFGAFF